MLNVGAEVGDDDGIKGGDVLNVCDSLGTVVDNAAGNDDGVTGDVLNVSVVGNDDGITDGGEDCSEEGTIDGGMEVKMYSEGCCVGSRNVGVSDVGDIDADVDCDG